MLTRLKLTVSGDAPLIWPSPTWRNRARGLGVGGHCHLGDPHTLSPCLLHNVKGDQIKLITAAESWLEMRMCEVLHHQSPSLKPVFCCFCCSLKGYHPISSQTTPRFQEWGKKKKRFKVKKFSHPPSINNKSSLSLPSILLHSGPWEWPCLRTLWVYHRATRRDRQPFAPSVGGSPRTQIVRTCKL